MSVRHADAPVNLLLVESGTTVGGTERVVWELATRLPRGRFRVRAWLPPAAALDEFAEALAARDVEVERVPEVDSRWDWPGMIGTWRRLRSRRPDILHLHHVWPASDRYLSTLAHAAGVEHLVVTEHIVGEAHSGSQRALKRDELQRADAVTAVSVAVVDALVRDYGIARDRVRVVPNGAEPPDEAREAPEARAWRERVSASPLRPLWVVAGRLEAQKGHDVLIDALARLQSLGLEFVVVFAGDGSLRESLERRVAERDLTGRVRFVGRLDDLGPLLTASDAVLLPSRWEGLPLVLLEALVRQRPVVASAVGGIPEVIDDGTTGVLVPPGDVEALAAALEQLHRRPDRAYRLGRAGGERVRESFTWEAVVDGFESLYDEVLGLASVTPRGVAAERGARA